MLIPKSRISYPIIVTVAITFVALSQLTLATACEVGFIKSSFTGEKLRLLVGALEGTCPLSVPREAEPRSRVRRWFPKALPSFQPGSDTPESGGLGPWA